MYEDFNCWLCGERVTSNWITVSLSFQGGYPSHKECLRPCFERANELRTGDWVYYYKDKELHQVIDTGFAVHVKLEDIPTITCVWFLRKPTKAEQVRRRLLK